jgi:hypothetical protein
MSFKFADGSCPAHQHPQVIAHEAVQNEHMFLYKVPTQYQLADMLKRGLLG